MSELDAKDLFSLPGDGSDDPRPIVARLVAELPEFAHLRVGEATVLVLMRAEPKVKGGRLTLGEMALPRFQGGLAQLALWALAKVCGGEMPDYLMLLDATAWAALSEQQREALVFHELCHAIHAVDKDGEVRFDDDGNPVWGIRGHDIEEFNAVVRRYGPWINDVQLFAKALRDGGAF